MLKLKLQYFHHMMQRANTLKKTLRLGKIEGRRRRGWDGWMASPTQWPRVWTSSGSWWWTGTPGVLQSTEPQRVGHNWATELNWTEVTLNKPREIIHGKQKVENPNIQIQWIILLKSKRLFHENQNWPKHNWPAGEPARSGNIGDSPYDVTVHGLLSNLDFSGHGLHCKPELWISSQSCGFPPCLKIALTSDFYFLLHPLQILHNVTSSSILVTSSIT